MKLPIIVTGKNVGTGAVCDLPKGFQYGGAFECDLPVGTGSENSSLRKKFKKITRLFQNSEKGRRLSACEVRVGEESVLYDHTG